MKWLIRCAFYLAFYFLAIVLSDISFKDNKDHGKIVNAVNLAFWGGTITQIFIYAMTGAD